MPSRTLALLLTLLLLPFTARATAVCEDAVNGDAALAEARQAAPKIRAYFDGVSARLKERGYLVDLAEIALLAEEHLLLLGPPGNAKSMFADLVLSHIVEDVKVTEEGQEKTVAAPSYYRIQMTKETTMGETHGPLDYLELNRSGKYVRLHREGMLMSRNVFVDEIFDSRANALRNLLGMFNERALAQGPHQIPGRIETVIAATNRYISEVYEQHGSDAPKAMLDRMALNAFVAGELEGVDGAVDLIRAAKRAGGAPPSLDFADLERGRALVGRVEIPDHVAKFLVTLMFAMKGETESLEQGALKDFREKQRLGEEAPPPYRATKYFSPRTMGKAAAILKAIVVKKWIASGGKRALTASLEDIQGLLPFFTLAGPSDEFLRGIESRTTNPHERVQISTIFTERDIFRRNYDEILAEANAVGVEYALADHVVKAGARLAPKEKEAYAGELLKMLIEAQINTSRADKIAGLSGRHVGYAMVASFAAETLRELLGDKYESVVTAALERLERERQAEIRRLREAEEAAERARLEEERRVRELARQEAAAAAARQKAAVELVMRLDQKNARRVAGTSFSHGVITRVSPSGRTVATFDGGTYHVFRLTRGAPAEAKAVPVSDGSPLQSALSNNYGNAEAPLELLDDETVLVGLPEGVRTFSLKGGRLKQSVELPTDNRRWAFDPATQRVLAYGPDGKGKLQLSVIDPATGKKQVKTIKLAPRPDLEPGELVEQFFNETPIVHFDGARQLAYFLINSPDGEHTDLLRLETANGKVTLVRELEQMTGFDRQKLLAFDRERETFVVKSHPGYQSLRVDFVPLDPSRPATHFEDQTSYQYDADEGGGSRQIYLPESQLILAVNPDDTTGFRLFNPEGTDVLAQLQNDPPDGFRPPDQLFGDDNSIGWMHRIGPHELLVRYDGMHELVWIKY